MLRSELFAQPQVELALGPPFCLNPTLQAMHNVFRAPYGESSPPPEGLVSARDEAEAHTPVRLESLWVRRLLSYRSKMPS